MTGPGAAPCSVADFDARRALTYHPDQGGETSVALLLDVVRGRLAAAAERAEVLDWLIVDHRLYSLIDEARRWERGVGTPMTVLGLFVVPEDVVARTVSQR